MSSPIKEIHFVPTGRHHGIKKIVPPLMILLSIAAGASLSLAYAPYSLWYMIVPGLLWLVFCLDYMRPGASIRYAFFHSLGFWGSSIYWIHHSIYYYGNSSFTLSAIMIVLLCLFMSCIFALLVWLYLKLTAKTGLFSYIDQPVINKILMFGAVWIGFEWIRELMSFPWLGLGNTVIDAPIFMKHWLPLIGATGSGFLIAIICSAIYYFTKALTSCVLFSHSAKSMAQPAIVLSSILAVTQITILLPEWTEPNNKKLNVALIQPNIPLAEKWNGVRTYNHIEQLFNLSRQVKDRSDLIIWPESAIAAPYDRFASLINSVQTSLDPASLLTGALRENELQSMVHNSIFLEDGSTIKQVYDKQILVPFGEFIPFVQYLEFMIKLIGLPELGLAAGPLSNSILTTNDFSLSSSICYEITFARYIAEGAIESDAILTISDDGWFGPTIGPAQHYQMARVRAAENGRYLIRVANNGITAIVNHLGEEVARLPAFTKDTLVASVPGYRGQTPYSLVSKWLYLPLILLPILICLLFHFVNRNKINQYGE